MDLALRADQDDSSQLVEPIGSLIAGKYRVIRMIGHGSTGAVYACQHVGLDKLVALKILHREMEQNAGFAERFKREAQAASRLEHPNSVRVLDFGQDESGSLYIAMEYVEGRDLLQALEEDGPFSAERAVHVMAQILDVLGVAHSLGIVHRDLKPENIIVRPVLVDGVEKELVTVCDFGIAQFAPMRLSSSNSGSGSGTIEVNEVGVVAGTPAYMSPEQAQAQRQDARSDLYSAGVVLYQLVTLHLPFYSDDPYTLTMKHCTELPPPPSRFGAVNPAIEEICLKALEKSREKRYQTAREMRAALLQALASTAQPAAYANESSSVRPLPIAIPLRLPNLRWGVPRPLQPSFTPDVAHELGAAVSAKTAKLPAVARTAGLGKRLVKSLAVGFSIGLLCTAGVHYYGVFRDDARARAPGQEEHVVQPSRDDSNASDSSHARVATPTSRDQAGENVTVTTDSFGPLAGGERDPQPEEIPVATLPHEMKPAQTRAAQPKREREVTPVAQKTPKVEVQAAREQKAPQPATPPPEAAPQPVAPAVPAVALTAAPATDGLKTPKDKEATASAHETPSASRSTASDEVVSEAPARTAPPPAAAGVPKAAKPAAPVVEPPVIERANVAISGIAARAAVSKASVRSALNMGAITDCYRAALRSGSAPSVPLTAQIALSTSNSGSVSEASMNAPMLPAGLRHCIEQVARRGRVREADTGEAQANITLAFAPR